MKSARIRQIANALYAEYNSSDMNNPEEERRANTFFAAYRLLEILAASTENVEKAR